MKEYIIMILIGCSIPILLYILSRIVMMAWLDEIERFINKAVNKYLSKNQNQNGKENIEE